MTGHDWTSPDVLPVYAKFELQCSEASVATHHRRLNTGTPPGRWQRCVVAVADGAVYIKNQGSVLPKASTWGMERQQGTHQSFPLCRIFFSRSFLALTKLQEPQQQFSMLPISTRPISKSCGSFRSMEDKKRMLPSGAMKQSQGQQKGRVVYHPNTRRA